MCVVDSLILLAIYLVILYMLVDYVLLNYHISCAHMDHIIKSRGSSYYWCVFAFKYKIQNKAHSKGELRLYFISFETCKIMYCHQTPKRGRLKEHFPPNWFWRLLTIHYLLTWWLFFAGFYYILAQDIGFPILLLIIIIAQRKFTRRWFL
jgi:hypothetical protein